MKPPTEYSLYQKMKTRPVFHISFLKETLSKFGNIAPNYANVKEIKQESHDPINFSDERK
jgi:hypothetical protein